MTTSKINCENSDDVLSENEYAEFLTIVKNSWNEEWFDLNAIE